MGAKTKTDILSAVNDNALWLETVKGNLETCPENHEIYNDIDNSLTKVWYLLEQINGDVESVLESK